MIVGLEPEIEFQYYVETVAAFGAFGAFPTVVEFGLADVIVVVGSTDALFVAGYPVHEMKIHL